jgi:hypothetical protein
MIYGPKDAKHQFFNRFGIDLKNVLDAEPFENILKCFEMEPKNRPTISELSNAPFFKKHKPSNSVRLELTEIIKRYYEHHPSVSSLLSHW